MKKVFSIILVLSLLLTACAFAEEACMHNNGGWIDNGDGTCSWKCADCGEFVMGPYTHEHMCNDVYCLYCGVYAPDGDTDHYYFIANDDRYCWLKCQYCGDVTDKTDHVFDGDKCVYCGYVNQLISELLLNGTPVSVSVADPEWKMTAFTETAATTPTGTGFVLTVQEYSIEGYTLILTKEAAAQLDEAGITYLTICNQNWKEQTTVQLSDILAAFDGAADDDCALVDALTGEITPPVIEEAEEEIAEETEEASEEEVEAEVEADTEAEAEEEAAAEEQPAA